MSTLRTDRLVLRPFREGDAEMMYRNRTSDENVAKYCHRHKHQNLDSTVWLLNMYIDEAASGFEYRRAITEKGNDEPIGAIDVVKITDNNKTAEVGYDKTLAKWGSDVLCDVKFYELIK